MDVYSRELLEALREEEGRLKNWIDACIEEREFAVAAYHQEGLYDVQLRIHAISRLNDPAHDQKESLPREKKYWQKIIAESNDLHIVRIAKEELAELDTRSFPSPAAPPEETQWIDDALYCILENKEAVFTLHFDAQPEFRIGLSGTPDTIRIDVHTREFRDVPTIILQMQALGFSRSDTGFVYEYPRRRFKNAIELKALLAHVLFDVFHTGSDVYGSDHKNMRATLVRNH